MIAQRISPYKFLDAYQKEDKDIFFGRKDEVDDLYDSLSGVKQLLLYGPSGSGKTSLIECGLRNKFSDLDWLAITIRRGNNINNAFFESINNRLKVKINPPPDSDSPKVNESIFCLYVQKLYEQSFRPVYLLFDQFEELLIQGKDEEKKQFFQYLYELIHFKIPCKVILIMREDFIGNLSAFESICPGLFQNRFRVEKMGEKEVKEVVISMLTPALYKESFEVESIDELCKKIMEKLPDERQEIELAHVQIFLGELWDRAISGQGSKNKPLFKPSLIMEEEDNLKSVLKKFLDKQFTDIDREFGENITLEVLANMITNRNTKLQITELELKEELDNDSIELKKEEDLKQLLEALEQRRIIRALKVGEEKKYELSHDVLAKLVGESLPEYMRMREKAQQYYAEFKDQKGLLGQSEIDKLTLYKDYRAYPEALKTLLEASQEEAINIKKREKEAEEKEKARIARNFRTAKIVGAVFIGLSILVAFLAYAANDAGNKARNSAKLAQESLLASYASEITRYRREIEIYNINLASFNSFGAKDVEKRVSEKRDSLLEIKKTLNLKWDSTYNSLYKDSTNRLRMKDSINRELNKEAFTNKKRNS